MSDLISPIMSRYANFTMTSDGLAEINSLTYLGFESDFADPLPDQRLALVLVEPRLLAPSGDPALQPALMQSLRRLKGDLRAEGLLTRFIAADLYGGPLHKDGRVVLAVRQFFRDVRGVFSRFEGALLIGNFPEPTLVRNVVWAPGFISPSQLAIWPELISERADIVLADLSGHWESLYRQSDFAVDSFTAKPDPPTIARGWNDGESIRDGDFDSSDYTTATVTFRDAFYLDDAIVTFVQRTPTSLQLQLHRAERNDEVDSLDWTMTNIIARPDISVSRINARHIAVNPNPALAGTDGHYFLDSNGNPQTVDSATPLYTGAQHLNLFNFRDFDLERRLLINYFERNHRFRIGGYSNLPFRVAAISGTTDFDPHYYAGLMGAAATDFASAIEVPDATLLQYVDFLKTPAVLKYVMAHSDAVISQFQDPGNASALTSAVGGAPVRWLYDNVRYTPSFDGQGGTADLFVHRALWHHGTLGNAGASLVVHGGCNVNSIVETETEIYTSPKYGRWNNAEAFLFYTNCVALLSRAKGFNDAPEGFADGYRLSDRANFGSCWSSYYNAQSNDAGLTSYNIQRKRAYFWSINGDWSLRLRNRNALGIVGLDTSLKSIAVHPNRAWIDGWNFDAGLNQVRGIGDMDGDGIDEFVVTSEWGIGILKHDRVCFRTAMLASRDTWFGGWRWDATVNIGRDRIKAVADFTGNGKREIMVWSNWGLATLAYGSGTLAPTRIHANGTRLGDWLVNTADNTYAGQGRFDADSNQDMVVTSPWGLGLISMQRDTAVFMAPNGTRLGDWLLNTADNSPRLIADLDGDGFDEMVITSPWGLGVLKMVGANLCSVAMHPNGDNLGGYVVNNTHTFALSDQIRGGAQQQIVVCDASGIHLLALSGSRLTRVGFVPNGTRVDGWLVDMSNNRLQAAGDLTGDGRADFIIRSPWGIGILGMDAAAHIGCHTLVPYGTMLRDWRLESGDVIAGAGRLDRGTTRPVLLLTKP
jgi:hypothetical protein